jgi:FixJ family two-component response regulator
MEADIILAGVHVALPVQYSVNAPIVGNLHGVPGQRRRTVRRAAASPLQSDDYARRLQTLTRRESEVAEHMIAGKTSKMIARELGGSFRTVEIHRTRVMAKMAAPTLADLVRMAFAAEVAP